MFKKLKPLAASISIALTFLFPQIIHSMEPEKVTPETTQHCQGQKIIILTSTEKKIINKMVMFLKYQKESEEKGVPSLPMDIHGVIFDLLHELTKNPVLEGELIYTYPLDKKQSYFKIKDHLKEGMFDLSNKEIFGNVADDLVMTIDPAEFFLKHTNKVVILIAPRFLIEEQLNDAAAPFLSIFAAWKKDNEIGIFWRWGDWENLSYCDYLINQSSSSISQNHFSDLWKKSTSLGILMYLISPYFTPLYKFRVSCFIFKSNKNLATVAQG